MSSSLPSKASGSDVAIKIFSKTMERRHSNGGTKRTCFKEPRGLVPGLVLMTRDSRGEEPSPEGEVSLHPQMLPEVRTGRSTIGAELTARRWE